MLFLKIKADTLIAVLTTIVIQIKHTTRIMTQIRPLIIIIIDHAILLSAT
jgi:hypothetical protein